MLFGDMQRIGNVFSYLAKVITVGNAVRTSSQAGLTRDVSNVIKVIDDPLVYMSDSPGTSIHFPILMSQES
jgi:hypothetical protein